MLHQTFRTRWVLVFCAVAGLGIGQRSMAQQSGQSPENRQFLAAARRIHAAAITIDTHVDIEGDGYATEKLDPGIDNPELKCDLVKMVRGGVDGVFLAVWVGQGKRDADGYQQAYDAAIAKFQAIHRLTETMYPDRCELARSPADVKRIVATGKRAVMIGIENGYPIGTDLANLRKFYELGCRYMTLSHDGHNQICDSCNPRASLGDAQSEHNGLSPFGRQVVVEMNRLGIMIDVSHIAPKSFWDVLQLTRAPLIASHSACRALNDHPRNLDDRQIKALADNGGVIQIVPLASFLKAPSPKRRRAINEMATRIGIPLDDNRPKLAEASQQQRKQFRSGMDQVNQEYPAATIDDFLDHIDHAVGIAGIDHVGIGTDFDGGGGIVGFNDHSESLNVTIALLRRGYSEKAIQKIWGGNLLRVWRTVEKTNSDK